MYHHHRGFYPPPPPPPPSRKPRNMDPDCAICRAPATRACECEANSLETAIRQAEARAMHDHLNEIRAWVRGHAQDFILQYYTMLAERRRQAHRTYVDRITDYAYHYHHAPPHPNELNAAQAALRSGINDDWAASVQLYPEVLHYFYGLVDFTTPPNDDPAVRDPPVSALRRPPTAKRRGSVGGGGGSTPPTVAPSASMHAERDYGGDRRTPPVMMSSRSADRRTPGPPPERRRPPPSAYYVPQGYY